MTSISLFPHSYIGELGDKAAFKIIYLDLDGFL